MHAQQGMMITRGESLAWALSLFLLCVADGVCTLAHVACGAGELNPLMEFFLAISPGAFLAVKLGTAACAVYVLYLLLPRVPRARKLLVPVGVLYIGVCCYHVGGFLAM